MGSEVDNKKGLKLGAIIIPTPACLSLFSAKCKIKKVCGGWVGTVLRKRLDVVCQVSCIIRISILCFSIKAKIWSYVETVLSSCTFHEAMVRRNLRVPIPTSAGIDWLNIFSGEGKRKWNQAALESGKGCSFVFNEVIDNGSKIVLCHVPLL